MKELQQLEDIARTMNSPSDQALHIILNQLNQQGIRNFTTSDIKHLVPSAGKLSQNHARLERSIGNLIDGGVLRKLSHRRPSTKGQPEKQYTLTETQDLALLYSILSIKTSIRGDTTPNDIWAKKGGFATDEMKYCQKMAYALSFYDAIQNGSLDPESIMYAANKFPEVKTRNQLMQNLAEEDYRKAQHRLVQCKKAGLVEEVSQDKTLRLGDIRTHFQEKPSGLGKHQKAFQEYLITHPKEFLEGELISYEDLEKTGLSRTHIKGLVNHMNEQFTKEEEVNRVPRYQIPHKGRFITQNAYFPLARYALTNDKAAVHELINTYDAFQLINEFLKIDQHRVKNLATNSHD